MEHKWTFLSVLSVVVDIFMSGKHYTVALNFGVTTRYDGNHYMDIKVIKEWVCFL